MAVAHKTVISFGLVAIPISMYTATQDNDIHFNQLHKEDNSRIKYKKSCSHCGVCFKINTFIIQLTSI
jgi:DNA end-binding protein Ku